MNTLNINWITEGLMDVEFKKYVLLAYLKSCSDYFYEHKLYPPLGDLVFHYQNLLELGHNIEELNKSFPKELVGFDFEKIKLKFEALHSNEENISIITEILEFALPHIQSAIEKGKSAFDAIEKHIEISPIGIISISSREGYLLLHQDIENDVFVYRYSHSVLVQSQVNMRSLTLDYLGKEEKSISNSIEQIKLNIIRKYREFANPATFLCVSKIELPLKETFIPIAKRLMLSKVLA